MSTLASVAVAADHQSDQAPPQPPAAPPPGDAKPAPLGPAGIAAALEKLGTSRKGLDGDEAKSRLEKYGRNAIAAKEASRWQKLVGYFWGPIPWMIEAAALISLLRQDWPDFAVVAGLLLYNAAVGF
ncbi:MAG TPA: cation-transporting P-type ATPase [Geminicoccaceae bacterium]|nr:cation-transporting P-type ATPase [Geminicoccaceae bacterium]